MIIDYLFSDSKALAACSLVCRTWVPTSRSHLFRIAKLDEYNVDQFLDILHSPYPTFVKYVERLIINAGPGYMGVFETAGWVMRIIPKLHHLVGVRTLCMAGSAWEVLAPECQSGVLDTLPAVRRLEIYQRYPIFMDAIEWDNDTFRQECRGFSDSIWSIPVFRAFDEGSRVRPMRFFSQLTCLPPILSVCIGGVKRTELPSLNKFLRSVGESLQNIALRLHGRLNEGIYAIFHLIPQKVDLPQMISLI
jgi:hypothetical protein